MEKMSTPTNDGMRKITAQIGKEWPKNLIEDVLDPVEIKEYQKNPPSDMMKGLNHVLSQLTPREEWTIRLRYENVMTYREIAEIQSVSMERVRQIIVKASRKLRHPSRKKYIKFGYAYADWQRAKLETEDTLYSIVCKIHYINAMNREKRKRQEQINNGLLKYSELTPGVVNSLNKAGIITMQDLIDADLEKINRLPGIGVKRLINIKVVRESAITDMAALEIEKTGGATDEDIAKYWYRKDHGKN